MKPALLRQIISLPRNLLLASAVAGAGCMTMTTQQETYGPEDPLSLTTTSSSDGRLQTAASENHLSTTASSSTNDRLQALLEEEGLPIGATPAEVEKAWGAPHVTTTEPGEEGELEVWYYTKRRPLVQYRVTRTVDPETGEPVYQEEPETVYRDYVLRRATFKQGKLDAWRIYPEGLPGDR